MAGSSKDRIVPNKGVIDVTELLDNHDAILVELAHSVGEKGFNDDDIHRQIPILTKEERVALINKMVAKGLLDLYTTSTGKVIYKEKKLDPSISDPALKGADREERIVYGIIRDAGNKGIWMRDIRFKSNLIPTQLTKVLKSLENKKIIKVVKSVSAYKKKLYMLFNIEPDRSLTGGSWYSDEDFESEFVDVLNQQCYRYLLELKNKEPVEVFSRKRKRGLGPLARLASSSATPEQVCQFIKDLGISNIPLSEEDIKSILDTLVFDGKVERKFVLTKGLKSKGNSNEGEHRYYAVDSLLPKTVGLGTVQCGVCPIVHQCREVTKITPISCPYLNEWGSRHKAKGGQVFAGSSASKLSIEETDP